MTLAQYDLQRASDAELVAQLLARPEWANRGFVRGNAKSLGIRRQWYRCGYIRDGQRETIRRWLSKVRTNPGDAQ